MRVLIVTNTYPPADLSGVGTLAFELARSLATAGHEPRVLTRRPAAGDPHARPVGGPKLLFPLLAAWRFVSARGEPPWDLVHVHESDGALVAVALRLLRLLGRPAGRAALVATLQVSYVEERRAVRPVRADGRVVSRPTLAERQFQLLRAPLLALLGRLTARLADVVVAPSRRTADELVRDYHARAPVVIPNGVTLPPEPPPRPATAAPLVLYAGRLRSRKAVAVLLEAFRQVRERAPGCRLRIVGDGEQRAGVDATIARLGLGDAVTVTGSLPRDAVAAQLAEADVFCLPSTYEGLPLAILEAMAAGLPVVATAVSGNPEAVEDGVTGLLVPPESAEALAAALLALVADPALRQRMGEAGRRRAAERFSVAGIVAAHLALLPALVARRQAG